MQQQGNSPTREFTNKGIHQQGNSPTREFTNKRIDQQGKLRGKTCFFEKLMMVRVDFWFGGAFPHMKYQNRDPNRSFPRWCMVWLACFKKDPQRQRQSRLVSLALYTESPHDIISLRMTKQHRSCLSQHGGVLCESPTSAFSHKNS